MKFISFFKTKNELYLDRFKIWDHKYKKIALNISDLSKKILILFKSEDDYINFITIFDNIESEFTLKTNLFLYDNNPNMLIYFMLYNKIKQKHFI